MSLYNKDDLELFKKWFPEYFGSDGTLKEDAPSSAEDTEKPITSTEELRDALGESLSENSYRETEESMQSTANDRLAAGEAANAEADARDDSLYKLLLAYTKKQDGRYDELLREIAEGDYRQNTGAKEILAEYAAQGNSAAAHSLADGAAANGGNPDSYAAAQAARSRLALTEAGNAAARNYYGEQLDRLLKVISASGADMDDLYGRIQDNVDGKRGAAEDALSLGADLLSELASLQNDRRTDDLKELSSLLARAEEAKGEEISPMELDQEYAALTDTAKGAEALSPVDALIRLWKKYPGMQDYLREKYKEVLDPPYQFTE